MQTIDITKFTITELKALAYDKLSFLQHTQKEIEMINAEISKKSQEQPIEEAPVEAVVPEIIEA